MHDVFISYSTKDHDQAETVRNILEKNGIPCWMAPRDIPGGSNYTREIPIAIRGCQVFVLILSQNAQSSHWVLKELDSAVNCGKVILPFMLEDCQLNDEFNFLLTGAQRYAAYQKKVEALETLISRIRAITDGKESESAAPVQPQEPAAPEAPKKEHPKKTEYFGIAQCPACGGNELQELTGRIGRYTLVEKLTLLMIPLMAAVGGTVLALLSLTVTVMIDPLSDLLVLLTIVFLLVGIVGGGFVGNKLASEWIRRQRVRKHICEHPFRCTACRKEFLLDKT